MKYLLFFAAAMIEILGMSISVIGVGQMFGMNIIIILMAIAFDIGKITTVSMLQRYWGSLNVVMKGYGFIAIAVTMAITSFGAAAYLSKNMQAGVFTVEAASNEVQRLQTEIQTMEARKKQIDDSIAAIPIDAPTWYRKKVTGLQTEQEQLTASLIKMKDQLNEKIAAVDNSHSEASAIVTIAKSFNASTDTVIKIIVCVIIFVFDPFAVYLIFAANHVSMRDETSTSAEQDTVESVTEIEQQPQSLSEPSIYVDVAGAPLNLRQGAKSDILESVPIPPDLFDDTKTVASQVVGGYTSDKKMHFNL